MHEVTHIEGNKIRVAIGTWFAIVVAIPRAVVVLLAGWLESED